VTEFDIQLKDARLRISALRYSPQCKTRNISSRAETVPKVSFSLTLILFATRQCPCLKPLAVGANTLDQLLIEVSDPARSGLQRLASLIRQIFAAS